MATTTKEDLSYFKDLLRKYRCKPIICSFCGCPISFRDYVTQYEQEFKFCSKKCLQKYKQSLKPESDTFSSETEKVIYAFLTTSYPEEAIIHNVDDLIPPYELDFVFPDKKLVIEYNGTIHYTCKFGEKKLKRTKLNDRKKRGLVCKNLHYRMIRIWSELGLYDRPVLFKQVLDVLKQHIDIELEQFDYGRCVDILVSVSEDIEILIDDVVCDSEEIE